MVQTLRDFQYVDRDGRDQGANVREKARQLVCLLRDEERLRQERSQALKTKERMAGGGSGGGGGVYGGIPPSYHPGRRTSQPSMAVLYGEEFSRSRGSPSSFNCEHRGFLTCIIFWPLGGCRKKNKLGAQYAVGLHAQLLLSDSYGSVRPKIRFNWSMSLSQFTRTRIKLIIRKQYV